MTRRMILSLVILLSLILLGPRLTLAGGWAIVALDEVPAAPVAGEPVQIGFTTRQHGDKPFSGEPYLTARNTETGESVRADGEPEGAVGHHVVEVIFPSSGLWEWSITPMPFPNANQFYPLQVLPPASEVSQGQALFVAKGCVGCHYHPDIPAGKFEQALPAGTSNPWTGFNFTKYEAAPEYLRLWLKDPKAVKPKTLMPNLNLSAAEIEVLIDFVNRTETVAAARPGAARTSGGGDQALVPAANIASNKSAPAPTDLFFARPDGVRGSLVVYDMADRQRQFTLPAGMLSPDGLGYYTAAQQGEKTTWQVYDPRTGTLQKRLSLPGHWTVRGVSQTGRWLALTRLVNDQEQAAWSKANRWETGIQIIDTETGAAIHRLELEGNFEVEAISPTGDGLFLIEHLPAVKPSQYVIRLYDLAANRLNPEPLRSKTAIDEVMAGLAWGGVASPDGRWLLTLYLDTNRQVAFVHALNLIDKFPICLFLPSGAGDFSQLKDYTLTLSPDSRTIYAANASLGIVAEVSLESFDLTRQVEFEPVQTVVKGRAGAEADRPANHSLLSADGSRLYFTSGEDIWVYDTHTHQVDGPLSTRALIDGLGLSVDGQQLFVAAGEDQDMVFEVGAAALTSLRT